MPTFPSRRDVSTICREADVIAAWLVRQFGLAHHERDDLRQDLLLDLLRRLGAFDPARGTLKAFAGTVMAHHAGRLAARIRRGRTVFAPVSLDDPVPDGGTVGDTISDSAGYLALLGQPTDRIAETERRLELARALTTLPADEIRFCISLAGGTPTSISRAGQGGRSGLYRRMTRLRLDLIAAGLEAA